MGGREGVQPDTLNSLWIRHYRKYRKYKPSQGSHGWGNEITNKTRACSEVDNEFGCRSRVASLIPVPSHTFVECDREIISTVILLLPLIQEGLLSFTSEKYVHEILVNRLIRLAQEKCA